MSEVLTFLFTDIEGSTRLWEQDPDVMARALADHDRRITDVITQHGGRTFKTTGDGALAVFPDVSQAIRAAIAIQRGFEEGVVRVRTAIHRGPAEVRSGDFFGQTLNRTARILEAGWAGQVLLSEAAARALNDRTVEQATVQDLGSYRLRDLSHPEHLFQLVHPHLLDAFPPLRGLEAHPHNLPIQLSSFIGREQEVDVVRDLLAGSRLLTLTGTGGTGKTRLALQAAAQLLEGFPDGAWLVELAPITNPELVVQTVASSLALREQPGRKLLDSLLDYLRDRRLLLILDNCEHLIESAAAFCQIATAEADGLAVLATSREALSVPGETVYPVAPLPGQAAQHLFLERARSAAPGWASGSQDAVFIDQICRQLDGIPLALELAAARARALSPRQIAGRLNDLPGLLTTGARTALPRQRTLEATVAWSYDLLDEPERILFRRLSVFSGGFSLEAAEKVAGLPPIDPVRVDDLVFHLIDRSLVVAQDERYRMLETIRQFASEMLGESGEAEAVRRRHAEFFLSTAEAMEPNEKGANDPELTGQLETEHDNFRAALAWCLRAREAELGLRLVGAVFLLWAAHSHATEGRRWARDMLAMAEDSQPRWRAKALIASTWLSIHQGDDTEGIRLAKEGIALARQVGDRQLEAWGLVALGFANPHAEEGRASTTEALAISQASGDAYGQARAEFGLGLIAAFASDFVEAQERFRTALAIFEQLESRWWVAWTLLNLARVAYRREDTDGSRSRAEEARKVFREVGDRRGEAGALLTLGETVLATGDDAGAIVVLRAALSIFYDLGVEDMAVRTLIPLAGAELGRQPSRAVRLLGATAALVGSGTRMPVAAGADHGRYSESARASLEAEVFDKAWKEGQAMTASEAINVALEKDDFGGSSR